MLSVRGHAVNIRNIHLPHKLARAQDILIKVFFAIVVQMNGIQLQL